MEIQTNQLIESAKRLKDSGEISLEQYAECLRRYNATIVTYKDVKTKRIELIKTYSNKDFFKLELELDYIGGL